MDNNYTKKELIRLVIEHDVYLNIKKAMKYYGIEGTEDAIKRAYSVMPTLKDIMLETYRKIIRR